MMISVDAEKSIWKSAAFFHDKNFQQITYGRSVPQHNKKTYDKLTANITLNGAKEQDKDDHYPTSI